MRYVYTSHFSKMLITINEINTIVIIFITRWINNNNSYKIVINFVVILMIFLFFFLSIITLHIDKLCKELTLILEKKPRPLFTIWLIKIDINRFKRLEKFAKMNTEENEKYHLG